MQTHILCCILLVMKTNVLYVNTLSKTQTYTVNLISAHVHFYSWITISQPKSSFPRLVQNVTFSRYRRVPWIRGWGLLKTRGLLRSLAHLPYPRLSMLPVTTFLVRSKAHRLCPTNWSPQRQILKQHHGQKARRKVHKIPRWSTIAKIQKQKTSLFKIYIPHSQGFQKQLLKEKKTNRQGLKSSKEWLIHYPIPPSPGSQVSGRLLTTM